MYRKVFAICMLDSIHTARWLRQFEGEHIEFMLFPSSPHRGLHPFLKELLENRSNARFRVVPFGRLFGFPLWIVDKFFDNFFRGTLARVFIKNFQPTIVHALELQNAGYIALKALRNYKPKTLSLITTNWGSDIFWFQRFPKHKARLEQLMDLSDFHSAECSRDLGLARDLGFAGSFLPVIPNAGGFHDEILDSEMLPSASRTIILVKGYQGWVGRAKIAIEAIGEMANELSNYEIIIYSANHVTKRVAKAVASETELRFTVNGKGALTHSNLLELFAKAKVYIGLSASDGISTSLLEAMAMGAIPVQTSTSCCDEWFAETGIRVGNVTVSNVKDAIREAISLADNQKNAEKNRQTIRDKASAQKVTAIAQTFYKI